MRRIPLLKDLPDALAAYFMDDEEMPTARRRGLNLMEYLSGKISERVSHRTNNGSQRDLLYLLLEAPCNQVAILLLKRLIY